MAGIKKTNAMRELTAAGLDYSVLEYEYDENDLDGHHVADFLSLPYEEVFKTLVTRGESKAIYVFCLSVDDELDLKKAAKVCGEKRVEMIPVKELLNLTGYIRGGCSPVGMKKKYPTFFDEMVELIDDVSVSGGVRGMQIRMNAKELIGYLGAKVGDITA